MTQIKLPKQDAGSKTRPKFTEFDKLQNKIASSVDKLVKTKLEVFAQTVLVNMPDFKKKKDEEIAKGLAHLAEHIYKM